jgi:hypothetical protein
MLKMKMGELLVRKKALSPVIAMLLMVATAVAASIITSVWSMGLLGGLMSTGGSQTKEQLVMESYDWRIPSSMKIVVRNVGTIGVSIAAVYVDGMTPSSGFTPSTLTAGNAISYTLSVTATYTSGASCILKVVSETGGTFVFSMVAGKAV